MRREYSFVHWPDQASDIWNITIFSELLPHGKKASWVLTQQIAQPNFVKRKNVAKNDISKLSL